MTNKEISGVIKFEKACVMRQEGNGCDRKCERCVLLLPTEDVIEAYNKAIEVFETGTLTDIEQRIFLAAMSREEKVCKEIDERYPDREPYEDSLVSVCHSIERKVKKALWG